MKAILRIDHQVTDYDAWKKVFDEDPADRKGSGVRRYRISREVGDPNRVLIDLEFDEVAAAESMLEKLQTLWAGPASSMLITPSATVVEPVESQELVR